MATYMTADQLKELTDKEKPSAQIRWLEQNGWVYSVSAMGRPKVLVAYADQRGGLAKGASTTYSEPDFSHWGGQAA